MEPRILDFGLRIADFVIGNARFQRFERIRRSRMIERLERLPVLGGNTEVISPWSVVRG